jgi:hypothetical protein
VAAQGANAQQHDEGFGVINEEDDEVFEEESEAAPEVINEEEDDAAEDYNQAEYEPEYEENEPDDNNSTEEVETHDVENQGAHNALEEVETHNTEDQGARDAPQDGYNLRNRTNTTNARFRAAMDEPFNSKSYFPPTQLVYKDIFTHIMTTPVATDTDLARTLTQMSANAGLKKHGRKAEEALLAEFTQLEDLNVYEPLDPNKLTSEQKRGALRAINLIKEKRCGRLKGRTVADGRPQRNMYDKSKTASPTVATDSLMLSIIVDAHERRDVATADITGAYLKADMKDFTIMKFTGASVDILCEMNPRHVQFVAMENGTKSLYVKLVKAIYGCVQSALLWYQLFYSHLKDIGFELNPYDPCVANKQINGKQCTIVWYVDDTKISHADPDVVTNIIERIEERFGKMTVKRGPEHIFLGMKIIYNKNGTAEVTMRDYLEEAIMESELNVTRIAATPARRDLFDIDEDAKRLGKKQAEVFHSVVAKLLYVSIRARSDILLAISFLCTRVSKSTVEDEAKLKRVLEYLNGTLHFKYVLGADNLTKLRSWVDASYAVHPDMKSHTGGVMSFGLGGLVCKSSKQKLNTKSSTEAEVVGASDYLPNTMWAQMFLEGQGYKLEESIMEQDNESAMKLEKTAGCPLDKSPDTSTYDTFGLRTERQQMESLSDTAQLCRCLQISSQNHCRETCSVVSAMLF